MSMVITNDHAVDERAFPAVVMDDSTPEGGPYFDP